MGGDGRVWGTPCAAGVVGGAGFESQGRSLGRSSSAAGLLLQPPAAASGASLAPHVSRSVGAVGGPVGGRRAPSAAGASSGAGPQHAAESAPATALARAHSVQQFRTRLHEAESAAGGTARLLDMMARGRSAWQPLWQPTMGTRALPPTAVAVRS